MSFLQSVKRRYVLSEVSSYIVVTTEKLYGGDQDAKSLVEDMKDAFFFPSEKEAAIAKELYTKKHLDHDFTVMKVSRPPNDTDFKPWGNPPGTTFFDEGI